MRELLFRGFHLCDGPETIVVDGEKVTGRWVEGYFVRADGQINNGKCYILPDIADFSCGDGGNRIRIGCFVEVPPSTVGQYSGLTDKNGKRIFEWDKVKGFNDLHQREEVYDVMWECNNGFYFVDDCGTEWHPEHIIPCEIIGTVFDEE